MKKLLFCFVFIINVIAFGANVYFLNDGIGYIYTNGQTFYSEQNGRALVLYHIWVDPTKYSVDEWGARFKSPDGSWSDWSHNTISQGVNECFKAGTWYVQGRVHVVNDIYGYSNYYMYTDFTLYFYVVDYYAPSAPQNLTFSLNLGDNHIRLQWSANTEYDLGYYEISRKINEGGWSVITTTTNTYWVDPNWAYNSSAFDVSYRIRAKDINNNYSNYSNVVTCHPYPMNKRNYEYASADIPLEYKSLCYPNPFNPTTTICYQLKEKGFVSIKVYDILGRVVADLVNEVQDAGDYSVLFDGSNLCSGIYFCSIQSGNYTQVIKMVMSK